MHWRTSIFHVAGADVLPTFSPIVIHTSDRHPFLSSTVYWLWRGFPTTPSCPQFWTSLEVHTYGVHFHRDGMFHRRLWWRTTGGNGNVLAKFVSPISHQWLGRELSLLVYPSWHFTLGSTLSKLNVLEDRLSSFCGDLLEWETGRWHRQWTYGGVGGCSISYHWSMHSWIFLIWCLPKADINCRLGQLQSWGSNWNQKLKTIAGSNPVLSCFLGHSKWREATGCFCGLRGVGNTPRMRFHNWIWVACTNGSMTLKMWCNAPSSFELPVEPIMPVNQGVHGI